MSISVGSSSVSSYYDQYAADKTKQASSTESTENIAEMLNELATAMSSGSNSSATKSTSDTGSSSTNNKVSLNFNGMSAMSRMQGPPPGPPPGGADKMKDASTMTDAELTAEKEKMSKMYNSLKASGQDVSKLTDVSSMSNTDFKDLLTKMQSEQSSDTKTEKSSGHHHHGGGKVKDASTMTDAELTTEKDKMAKMYTAMKDSGQDVSKLTDVSSMNNTDFKSFLTKMQSERGSAPPPSRVTDAASSTSSTSSTSKTSSLTDEEVNKVKESMVKIYNSLKSSGSDVSGLTDVSSKSTDDIKDILSKMQQRMSSYSQGNNNSFDSLIKLSA